MTSSMPMEKPLSPMKRALSLASLFITAAAAAGDASELSTCSTACARCLVDS